MQCCVLHSVCSSSVLALIGFAVARNKDSCPSHLRALESDRTPVFLLLRLLLLLLLLLASASAAAAACFCCGCLCCCCCCWSFCWACSVFNFLFSLVCESYMVVDVVQNPQTSNVYEDEKKHVRCVGVFSGMMYGCVRYVLRVARADSGWGY